jgi:hypothetical protein
MTTPPTDDNNFIDQIAEDLFDELLFPNNHSLLDPNLALIFQPPSPFNTNVQQDATPEQVLFIPDNPGKRKSPSESGSDDQSYKRARFSEEANMVFSATDRTNEIDAIVDSPSLEPPVYILEPPTEPNSIVPASESQRHLVCMGNKRNRPKNKVKPKSYPEDQFMMKFALKKKI